MHLHRAVGNKMFVKKALLHLQQVFSTSNPEATACINSVYRLADPVAVEQKRLELHSRFSNLNTDIDGEPNHEDIHYVSRVDLLGLFQSALAKVFADIPELQGYGDRNPAWLVTLIEGAFSNLSAFFRKMYGDVHGGQTLLASVLAEWKNLSNERAPYPPGKATILKLDETSDKPIALLADWGGDNPAARKVASVALENMPARTIHLGDIYYGGTQIECEEFLKLWPMQKDQKTPGTIPPDTSLALNGNHEMYSGGGPYFNTVLPAFKQPQPFFCLEGDHWRLIGLDTAYMAGRLKPRNAGDATLQPQWDWLIDILRNRPKRANILLTHHQPVSAHSQEFSDSRALWNDIQELLSLPGIGQDAIYGWFFGHEHRCAIYDNHATPFNARLIGNGCIPHHIQTEKTADPGCTPVTAFNKRAEGGSEPDAAVSSFALLRFVGPALQITYLNEDSAASFGSETWYANQDRRDSVFAEADQIKQG